MKKICVITLLVAVLGPSINLMGQSLSWYKSFTGTIDKYPVTMHLHKKGDSYAGYYYYDKMQQPVYMTGNDSAAGPGKIAFTAFIGSQDYSYESLILTVKDSLLSGIWIKGTDTAKALIVKGVEKVIPGQRFTMIYSEGTTLLRPKKPESPQAMYQAASIWPTGTSATDIALKKIITNAFGEKNSTVEIGQVFLNQKKKFMTSYLQDNKDLADSDWVEFPQSYSVDEEQSLLIVYHTPQLLTLGNFSYSFNGGAHGNYGTGFMSVNLTTNRVLKVTDVVTPAGLKQLNALLEKNFRKQYSVPANETLSEAGLFENSIKATDNFYVTGKGIGFNYVPYEIGPYAMGEINIYIPFSDLQTSLQPAFKKLIGR